MLFSDTTNKNGLLQDCEFLLNLGDAGITGDSSSLALPKVFTRLINQRLHKMSSIAFSSQDGWDWDDTSNGLYPIATRSLAANQQDYKFTTALWALLGLETATPAPTMTIASPCVVTLTNHGLNLNDAVSFTTTGALPTGVTSGTTYYVISAGLGASTFEISATVGGSAVNTSGSQSGTHTLYRSLAPLRIKRVEVTYDGSNWRRASPYDINQTDNPTNTTSIGSNYSTDAPVYDLASGSIFLYPIPTAAVTAGLKIWFARQGTEFISTDTSKIPPFDADFHRMLSIGASYDYAFTKNLPQVPTLKAELDDYEIRFRARYGSKDEDRRWSLQSLYTDTFYG